MISKTSSAGLPRFAEVGYEHGRTEGFDHVQGRQRLNYARQCHEAGELVGSDNDDTYAGMLAVSRYVLAGTLAARAIGAGAVGERWRREDHGSAIGLLRSPIADDKPSKHLSTLLDLKDAAHYSTVSINTSAEEG